MSGSARKKEKVGGISGGRREKAHSCGEEEEFWDNVQKPCQNGEEVIERLRRGSGLVKGQGSIAEEWCGCRASRPSPDTGVGVKSTCPLVVMSMIPLNLVL